MKNFESLDIFRKRCLLVYHSFQLFILFFESDDSFLVSFHQFLCLHLHLFGKFGNFFIFYYDLLVQIGAQFIFSLMEVFSNLIDLVSEEQQLELVIVDNTSFGLLKLHYSLV